MSSSLKISHSKKVTPPEYLELGNPNKENSILVVDTTKIDMERLVAVERSNGWFRYKGSIPSIAVELAETGQS